MSDSYDSALYNRSIVQQLAALLEADTPHARKAVAESVAAAVQLSHHLLWGKKGNKYLSQWMRKHMANDRELRLDNSRTYFKREKDPYP